MPGGIENRLAGRAEKRLTDLQIKAFVLRRQAGRKLADGGGLYLLLTPGGTASWRVKYRFGGREKLFTIGAYPAVSLEAARAELAWVKERLREGADPMLVRRLERAANAAAGENSFAAVAADWLAKQRKLWSAVHYEKSRRALARDVYPHLGRLPVRDITPAMVAGVIETIAHRGVVDTAAKILQHVAAIFRLAQARGLRTDNPAEPVKELLPKKKLNGRQPALLSFKALGEVLRSAEAAHLTPAVRMAHRLCAFSAARISNVVQAEWSEFDLDAEQPEWVIPRRKLKAKHRHHDHRVFLFPAIAEELRAWRSTIGGQGYVFPSPLDRRKHVTREAIEKVYRETLGLTGRHTPHGWRAAFSTLARDHGFSRDAVELALDHVHDNDVVRAYDRGERLLERIRLMNWWGEQLIQAQRGAEVVPMPAERRKA